MLRMILGLCFYTVSFISLYSQSIPERFLPDIFSNTKDWYFHDGSEFSPPGKGSFQVVDYEGKKAGEFVYDFLEGGKYISANHKLTGAGSDYTELRFSFKADDACKILLRLYDEGGECFQYYIPYNAPKEVQNVRHLLGEKSKIIYGGKVKNQTFDFPVSKIEFGVERLKEKPCKGKAVVWDVEFIR